MKEINLDCFFTSITLIINALGSCLRNTSLEQFCTCFVHGMLPKCISKICIIVHGR